MVCSECGSNRMRLTSEPLIAEYHGESFTVDGIERWQCDTCGNYELSPESATRLGRALHDMWVAEHGYDPLSPREIRRLRHSLGMTQVQLENALGLSSPTVSRWETGRYVPSKTADLLMRRLAADAARDKRPRFTVMVGGRTDDPDMPYHPTDDGGNEFVMEG